MAKFEALPTAPLSPNSTYLHHSDFPEVVHLEDPAQAVLIDFKQTNPPVIRQNTSITDAEEEMKESNIHVCLVVDENDSVIGVVNTEDIMGNLPIRITQEERIPRNKISTKRVMRPCKDMQAISLEALRHAKVGDIVETLKAIKQPYMLVTRKSKNGEQHIRGIFSSLLIRKQLHMDIKELSSAESVAELKKHQD